MTPDEAVAKKVLDDVMAGCFGNPPHDAADFRWRVVQASAAALQAERARCLGAVATLAARYRAEHDAIPVDAVMALLVDLRLLATACAPAP